MAVPLSFQARSILSSILGVGYNYVTKTLRRDRQITTVYACVCINVDTLKKNTSGRTCMFTLSPSCCVCSSCKLTINSTLVCCSYRQAQASVLEALPRLKKLNIFTKRPGDYFAEMAKSDQQMTKVRSVCQRKNWLCLEYLIFSWRWWAGYSPLIIYCVLDQYDCQLK